MKLLNHASHNFHALAQSVMMQRTEYCVPNSNTRGCVSVGTLFPNDINYQGILSPWQGHNILGVGTISPGNICPWGLNILGKSVQGTSIPRIFCLGGQN